MARTFILSDESVNEYGFRVLTGGIDLRFFKKNPVMLYAHIRSYETKGKDGTILPIGKWENIRKEDGKLLADAVFDEDDEFAMKIAGKVEKDMLNAASVGLDTQEWSEDEKVMEKGQTLPTITKSILKEASIADVPGNGNAVKLFGKDVTVSIGLSSSNPQDLDKLFLTNKKSTMKILIASMNKHATLSGTTLSDNAEEKDVIAAFDGIVTKLQDQVKDKDAKIATLTGEKADLETKLKEKDEQNLKDKAIALVDSALSSKKIVEAEKENYLNLASASEEGYKGVKAILEGKKGYTPVSTQLNSDGGTSTTEDKLAEDYDTLFKNGKLQSVKETTPERFKEMYKAKWGKEPVN